MQDFRRLAVWRKAHVLALAIYRTTASFPREELFGLTSQLRRGASSIAANIAEGCGRGSDADFRRFLHMALGSSSETEYHLLLARDLDLLDSKTQMALTHDCIEIKRMLGALIKRLK